MHYIILIVVTIYIDLDYIIDKKVVSLRLVIFCGKIKIFKSFMSILILKPCL